MSCSIACRGSLVFFLLFLIFSQNSWSQALSKPTDQEVNNPYSAAMYFETRDGSVKVLPPEFEYDLNQENGQVLRIGNVLLSEKTFLVTNRNLESLFSKMNGVLTEVEKKQNYLLVKWPLGLMSSGLLEMISREGKVIWTYDINETSLKTWQLQLSDWKSKSITAGYKAEDLTQPIFQIEFGIPFSIAQVPIQNRQSYRFCLTQKNGNSFSKLCTRKYSTKKQGSQSFIARIESDYKPRVLLQSEEVPLKGDYVSSTEQPSSFYADLTNGISYEFVAKATAPQLMDISWNEEANTYQIVGTETAPNNPVTWLNPPAESKFVQAIGFDSTIKDERKFWATQIDHDKTELYFPGQGAGLFHQKLIFTDIPSSRLRPFLSSRLLPGTYVDGAIVQGERGPDVKVKTSQNSIIFKRQNPSFFTWRFGAKNKGEVNRSYLTVSNSNQTARAYYELYRGYSNELSGRFSGILSTGEGLLIAEFAYFHWFENIFGWENEALAKQRWGLSVKQFQSLNQIPIDTDGNKASLGAQNVDLKYRFVPGLWTREETTGVMLDYQRITFAPLSASMLGVGWFWARSMPLVFDRIFNLFPFMNYKKWVDMEIIYYAASMDPNVVLNANFALNFHGQVLWKNWIFGEAGFGVKRYAFSDPNLDKGAELNTFYGTVGLGIKF